MQTYSVFHALIYSWYSKSFYRNVHQSWGFGKSILALLFVLTLTWIPLTYSFSRLMSDLYQREWSELINQFPEISIKNGEATLNATQPYFIKGDNTESPAIILDTTGKIKSLDGHPETSALLTKTHFHMRKSGGKIEIVPLGKEVDFSITRERIQGWAKKGLSLLPFVAYPVALFGSLAYRMVQALLYALLGLILVSVLKINLTYDAILKLTFVSLIPPVIIKCILWTTHAQLPLQWMFGLATGLAYMGFAIASSKDKTENLD